MRLFCDIKPEEVIECIDADTLYEIPLNLQAQNLDQIVVDHLKLNATEADMTDWKALSRPSEIIIEKSSYWLSW